MMPTLSRPLVLLAAALAPQHCGGYAPGCRVGTTLPVQARLRLVADPRAALSVDGTEAAEGQVERQKRQAQQVREALDSLLPSFQRGAEESSSRGGAAPTQTGPLAGTLPALLMARDGEALKARDEKIEESYEKCRLITAEYAKTFYFGTSFFSEEKRKDVWAVYAWCRRTDDIVDKPRKETVSLRQELDDWRFRLDEVFAGRAYDDIDLALVDTVQKYPDLSITPFEDMIKVY